MIRIILISIITILFCFCLYFFLENRKLKKKIDELEKQTLELLERKITNNTDQISIQNISNDKKQPTKLDTVPKKVSPSSQHVSNQNNKPDNPKTVSSKPNSSSNNKKTTVNSTSKIYQKNTIQTRNTVTSPVSITNKDTIRKETPRRTYQPPKEEAFDMNKLTLDLNEFIKKSEKVVPIIKEKPTQKDYLKEISKKMADEIKPQTIELTDYEKEQEEHAIISYKELLAVKDKLIILDDDEDEDINFIEELKSFRNGL